MGRNRSGMQGFTLTELMIVISILAILSAVAVPPVRSFVDRMEVKSVARQMYGDLYYAKIQAIRGMVPYSFITGVDSNGTYYWMVIKDVDGDGRLDSTESLKKRYYLPETISIVSGSGINVTFDQQGLADNAYTYSLKSSRADDYSVNVSVSPVGFISIKTP